MEDGSLLEELECLREVPPLSQGAVAAGRRRFLNEAAGLRERRAARRPGVMSRPGRRALLALLVLFFTVSGVAVIAAPQALPDSPLYAVKLTWEDLRLATAAGAPDRADLALDLVDARLVEIERLVRAGRPVPAALLLRLEDQAQLSLHSAALLTDREMRPLLERLQDRLHEQIRMVEQVMLAAPTESREVVRSAMVILVEAEEHISLGLRDPASFRRGQEGSGRRGPSLPTTLPVPTWTVTLWPSSTPTGRAWVASPSPAAPTSSMMPTELPAASPLPETTATVVPSPAEQTRTPGCSPEPSRTTGPKHTPEPHTPGPPNDPPRPTGTGGK